MNLFAKLKKQNILWALLIIIVIVIVVFVVIRPGTKEPRGEDLDNLPPVQFEVDEDEAAALIAAEETNKLISESKEIVVGADLVTKEGKVINSRGLEVRSDVSFDSVDAPKQTLAIKAEELPEEIIKLTIGPDGFVPNEFRVKAGAPVSLALSALDSSPHVFTFKDESLKAVYLNVNTGETKATIFPAPSEKGLYNFYCDFPGHRSLGEEGVMIVE